MRFLRKVLFVVAATLLLAGCSGKDSGGRSAPGSGPIDSPPWRPLTTASAFDQVPRPMSGEPSIDEVEDLSSAGPGRLYGEQYAVNVAQLMIDVRPGIPGRRAVEAVGSSTLDRRTAKYLVEQLDDLGEMGSERHFDPTPGQWIRSDVSQAGTATEVDRVNAEVAGNMVSVPLGVRAWYRVRVDVAWEGDAWRVVGFSDGLYGPDGSANLTPQQQREFLTGPGWRRIPPA